MSALSDRKDALQFAASATNGIRQVCLVAPGVLVVETCIVKFLLETVVTPVWFVLAHLAVVVGLGIWTYRLKQAEADLRLPLLLAATTAVLGPIGPAGTLLAAGLLAWYTRSAMAFADWYSSLFPEEEAESNAELYEQVRRAQKEPGEKTSVEPFIDVLLFGTSRQKQSAISLITRHFQPVFMPALRVALDDTNNTIRVQAATAISRIENNFVERSLELGRAVKGSPDDAELLLALARHYDDYAFTGVLDGKRENDNRAQAVAAYRHYLTFRPGDLVVRAEVGRILVRKGDFEEAVAWLEESIQQGFASPQIVLWFMESLYCLGRFEKLRAIARSYEDEFARKNEFPIEVAEAVRLWTANGSFEFQEAPAIP